MTKATPTPQKKKGVMSIDEVKSRFNPRVIGMNKIAAALKELGPYAMEENDFKSIVGMNNMQLATFRQHFIDHIAEQRQSGRTRYLWAGTVEAAEETRAALVE